MAKAKVKPRDIKIPVSERALFARMQRYFAKDDCSLRRNREGTRAELEMGRYFVLNERGFLLYDNLDLEGTAREEGLLKPYEKLEDEA